MLWRVPLVFAAVGVVSMVLPEVMGNGRALVQQTFNRAELVGSFTVPALLYTLGLFVAKAVLVVAALRHGSYGGTLTPGVALGASGGFVVAGTLVCVCPWVSGFPLGVTGLLSAAGVLGAAVFLALSMDAPLSSVALVVGFTGQSWGAYVPLAVAVGVAWGVKRLWEAHRARVLAGA